MRRRTNVKPHPQTATGRSRRFVLAAVAFHVFVFAYVLLRIRPAMGYERAGPHFFLNREFLGRYLEYPGGLLDYVATGMAQLNYTNATGALAFTIMACLAFYLTSQVWRFSTNRCGGWVAFAPPFLLLMSQQVLPEGRSFALGTGFCIGIGLALGYGRMPGEPVWLRVAVGALAAPLVCAGAGVWPCLLFLIAITLFEIQRSRRGTMELVGPGLGIALSALLVWWGQAALGSLLNPWGGRAPLLLAGAVWLVVPGMLLLAILFPRWRAMVAGQQTGPSVELEKVDLGRGSRGARFWYITTMAAVVGAVGLGLTYDNRAQAKAELEYAARCRDDARVLGVAAACASLTAAEEVRLHVALYRAGRLLTDLFTFTNLTTWELLPGMTTGAEAARTQAETLLELGQINDAEHLAHEALEFSGNRPDLLRLLAHVNVLKDRPVAARVFLNALQDSPVHRVWAATRLREITSDPRLANDLELGPIRARMVTTDLPHDGMPTATLLEQLLHSNPRNQMAFEYLLAHRLLTCDLDRFAKKVGQLKDFGYTSLPRHCEEAVLLHERVRHAPVDLGGWTVRAETRQRFQAFCAMLDRGALRSDESVRSLKREFGSAYWFYYVTHASAEGAAGR